MRKKTALDLCTKCVEHALSRDRKTYVENPAVLFTKKAKDGRYDILTDSEYEILLEETEELAKLWNDQPRKTAGNILAGILANVPEVSPAWKAGLADLFADLLAGPAADNADNYSGPWIYDAPDKDVNDDDVSKDTFAGVINEAFEPRSPREIRDSISRRVMGQPEAVKAAALIMWHRLSGRRSNAVFCGPSGCGKSEIWRALSEEYPGMIRMADFSRFTAEGWKGSLHVRDLFDGIDPEDIRRNGLIVVLDEADKIVCEHAVGGGGTDYNAILQNNLLKIMDGDVIEFGAEDKKPALSVDCSNVSVVMLGAFERLLEGKTHGAKHIGFGSGAANADAGKHRDISYDDLIHAGMRREVAGRINKIVALDPLSFDDYKAILMGPVLAGLRQSTQCKINIARAAGDALAEQAITSGLGVRWMRSAILNAIDDALFDKPDAAACTITMQDGELRCRAQKGRKAAHSAPSRPTHAVPVFQECDFETMEDMPF